MKGTRENCLQGIAGNITVESFDLFAYRDRVFAVGSKKRAFAFAKVACVFLGDKFLVSWSDLQTPIYYFMK